MDHSEPAPACSIVVPAFNVGPFIRETLESVLQQSSPDWEAIVVDDGSTDDTAAVAGAFEDPRISLVQQSNRGVSLARNAGLARARASKVLFLDADDRLFPDALARLTAALEADPALIGAYGEAATIDAQGRPLGGGRRPVFNARPSGRVLEALVYRNAIVTPGVLCLRRAPVVEAGGFNSGVTPAEDWELWCRLAVRGPFQYIGGPPVLAYRLRSGSATRTQGQDTANALRAVESVFADPDVALALGGKKDRLYHQAVASVHELAANQPLRDHNWAGARAELRTCLDHAPARVRPRILLAFTTLRWLPAFIERGLK